MRIGNGAADQLQLDIYGEAMDSIYFVDQALSVAASVTTAGTTSSAMIDWLCEHWDQPDEGIWETRGGRKPFVYGRVDVAGWRSTGPSAWPSTAAVPPSSSGGPASATRSTAAIMTKGWNETLQAFVQYEGSDVLDASLLLMPLVGFIVPSDPKWQSTLTAMDKVLVSDSLVYRYDPKASPDGLQGSEGTFSLCTFLVRRRARTLRASRRGAAHVREDAHLREPRRASSRRRSALTGEQLGNFPQAFTHLALINAAMNLNYQLDHGAGYVNVVAPSK